MHTIRLIRSASEKDVYAVLYVSNRKRKTRLPGKKQNRRKKAKEDQHK